MDEKPLPPIGYGTAHVSDTKEVEEALETGYRLIDTAQWYENEHIVGQALARSGIPRDEVTIASKVLPENLAREDVLRSTAESLERIGIETIDVLYVHWPTNAYNAPDTLAAFDQLVDEGKVRWIGVSNFTPELLEQAIELTSHSIHALQVEMHPLLQQDTLQEFTATHDVQLVAYSPLAKGKVLDMPELVEIGDRYGVSAAQVSLAWLMEKGVIPIPKATGSHISDNYAALDLTLDEADIDRINGIEREVRVVKPDQYEKLDSTPWE